jgi:DNA-binding SARP family transcriptional activator
MEQGHVEIRRGGRLQLWFLGPGAGSVDEHPISFRTKKTLALLAYLAMDRGPHQRERIADIFWPEADGPAARDSLRTALVYLRQALGEAASTVLIATKETVGITHGGVEVDFDLLKQAVQIARKSGDLRLRHQIQAAVSQYHGAFLAGLTLPDAPEFESWLEARRAYWRGVAAELLSLLATMQQEAGELSESMASLELWTSIEPDDELAWRRLIELHLEEGNLAGAHAAWERYRQNLNDVGEAPSRVMAELQQRIIGSSFTDWHSTFRVASFDSRHCPSASRQGEFEPLEAAYRRARNGRCEVVVITGAAEAGQRRLASDVASLLKADGADVIKGRALPSIGGLPFSSWISGLRQRLEAENAPEDLLEDHWLAELARLLPELLDRYPDLVVLPSDALTRGKTFEAVSRLGIAIGQRQPLAIVIDDAQWADPDTRDLVHYAARRWTETATPVLVVLVAKAAMSGMLEEWVRALEGETRTTRLQLPSRPDEAAPSGDVVAAFQPPEDGRFAFAGMRN